MAPMKSFLSRNRIKLTLLAVGLLTLYGFFLSYKSEETKATVQTGVAAKDAEIASLNTAKEVAEVKVEEAAKQVAKEVQKVKKQVADSTAVVLKQQKQEVIDSLTKHKPNEVLISDPDNPTFIAGALSDYKPDTIKCEGCPPIY
jgi:phage anti-repressor protein